jgi:hypothetical protein
LEPALSARVLQPEKNTEQDLCLDAAFVGKEEIVEA